jgi:acyl dehydratase
MSAPPTVRQKTVTRVQIARYAAATGDFNPLHFDDEHARRVGLPGIIGHGLLTLGFAAEAVTDWCGGDPHLVRSVSMRFREPVRPGDELIVEISVDGGPEPGRQKLAVIVRRGEVVVASGRASVNVNRSAE